MDQVGKEGTAQIMSIKKNKDNSDQKHQEQRKKYRNSDLPKIYID